MEYDYEELDRACPKCGEHAVRSRRCDEWNCDDGFIDEHEDDPINYQPGEEYSLCRECLGCGVLIWCAKCGCDINALEQAGLRGTHREEG